MQPGEIFFMHTFRLQLQVTVFSLAEQQAKLGKLNVLCISPHLQVSRPCKAE